MRILRPGQEPNADETVSEFSNTAAHVKHICIGEGAFVTVAPTDPPATVRIALNATEKVGLDRALGTDTCLEWIAAGELIVIAPPDPPPPEGGEGEGATTSSRRRR